MPNGRNFTSILFILTTGMFLVSECMAGSRLMVTPTRVVFDGNSRSAQVTLVNSGDESGTYRISLVNKRMTIDGQFEDVKVAKTGDQFADKFLRYSPRQVVLEPGKSQVVRFSLRKPATLQNGEYRSHILFKAIPKDAGVDIKSATSDTSKISISLKPIISISIPVIVRHGKTDVSVSFNNVKYQPPNDKITSPSLSMKLQRSGNQSVYGDILVEFVTPGGTSNVLKQIKGIAIYTPNELRAITLPLDVPNGLDLKSGLINIFYRSPVKSGGKVLAQTQLKVQ